MKRLKILSFIAVAAMAVGTMVGLAGCDLFGGKTHKISSAEELEGIQSNKNYELTSDIDLSGKIWSPRSLNNFNGNGYTIKNVTITNTNGGQFAFFSGASSIKNVVLDNVNMVISLSEDDTGTKLGGFVISETRSNGILENITVKNSSMVISTVANNSTNIGGICGESVTGRISGCSVENSSISVITAKSHDKWMQVGGIVGYARTNEIADCKFTDSTIYCKSLTCINVGGVIGEIGWVTSASVTNCISEGNEITLDATDTSYVSRLGGVVGNNEIEKGEFSCVVSKDNTLKVNARQTYGVGGLIGRNNGMVKNGLSDGNTITATLSRNDSSSFAFAGGFCSINNGSISRCVSQYNTVTATEFTGTKSACGFSGRSDGSLAYCGVKDNVVEGGDTNVLATSSGVFTNCFKGEEDGDWADIISILNLDTELWNFESGKLKLTIGGEII